MTVSTHIKQEFGGMCPRCGSRSIIEIDDHVEPFQLASQRVTFECTECEKAFVVVYKVAFVEFYEED